LVYIGQSINPETSDQTDLNKQHRYNLGGSGDLTFEAESNWCDPQAGRPIGGAGRPHMAALGVCFVGEHLGVF
jgi:hypothetical protein